MGDREGHGVGRQEIAVAARTDGRERGHDEYSRRGAVVTRGGLQHARRALRVHCVEVGGGPGFRQARESAQPLGQPQVLAIVDREVRDPAPWRARPLDAGDCVASSEEGLDQMTADESSSAGDDRAHMHLLSCALVDTVAPPGQGRVKARGERAG